MKINDLNQNVKDLSIDEAGSIVGGYTASINQRASLLRNSSTVSETLLKDVVLQPKLDSDLDRKRRCLIAGFC